jgi:hypothetical protein
MSSFRQAKMAMGRNFKQYWFKNCTLKYDGILVDDEKDFQGEVKFGDTSEIYT